MRRLVVLFIVILASTLPRTFAAPLITSINPASGVHGSSVRLVISGSNFSQGSTVTVKPKNAIVASTEVVNAGTIRVLLVLGAPATVDITVTTQAGTSVPVAFSITPNALGSAVRLSSNQRWQNSGPPLQDGIGSRAWFSHPASIWGDGDSLYVVDSENVSIRKIEIETASVTTIAGPEQLRFPDGTGFESDVTWESSSLSAIWGSGGSLYIAYSGFNSNSGCIRKFDLATRKASMFVGRCDEKSALGPDGDRLFAQVGPVVPQMWGDSRYLYLADANIGIRQVELSSGQVTTLKLSGDLLTRSPEAIWGDETSLYAADTNTIYRIDRSTGVATRIGVAPTSDAVHNMWGDGANLFVTLGHDIYQLEIRSGLITRVVGTDGPDSPALFSIPYGLWKNGNNLYVTDYGDSVIRRVPTDSRSVVTFAGTKRIDLSNRFYTLTPAIWGDDQTLYVAGAFGHAIDAINRSTGQITTIAGSHELLGSADGVGDSARFSFPWGIWGDGTNLYVSDSGNDSIRQIRLQTGEVTTIAGSPRNSGGVDGIGRAATFRTPSGMWGDGTNLYIADGNSSIRKLDLSTGAVSTVFVGTGNDYGSLWHSLWGDGDRLYFPSRGRGVLQMTLSSGEVSTFANLTDFGDIRYIRGPWGIWGDGVYIYVSCSFESASTIFRIRLQDRATAAVAAFPATATTLSYVSYRPNVNVVYGLWGDGNALYVINLKNSYDEWGVERLVPVQPSPPVLVSVTPNVINAGQTITATITGFNLTSDFKVPPVELPSVVSTDPALHFGKSTAFGLASLTVTITADTGAPGGERLLRVVNGVGGSNSLAFRINAVSASFPANVISLTTFSEPGEPAVAAYAKLEPNSSLFDATAIVSYRHNGVLVSEVAFPPALSLHDGRIYVESGPSFKTGIAIVNPDSEPALISFYFTDPDGTLAGAGQTTIPSHGQLLAFNDEPPFAGKSPFRGTFSFTSSSAVYVSALRTHINERSEFLMTAVPVATFSAGNYARPQALPHFADGGGWSTEIVLVNPTPVDIRGQLQFFGQGTSSSRAAPFVIRLDRGTGAAFDYVISANGVQRFLTLGSEAQVRAGSVRIIPDADSYFPSSLAIFSFKQNGITIAETGLQGAYPEFRASLHFKLESIGDFANKVPESTRTAIVANNVGDKPSSFCVAGICRTIPANGQAAYFPDAFPTSASLIVHEFVDQIVAQSFRARYNDRSELIFTAVPNLDSDLYASPVKVFPLVVNGGGYSTEFVSSDSLGGVTLKVFSQSGELLKIPVK